MTTPKTYYRVCHFDTLQGLWYNFNGDFTGLIHDKFDFCQNTELRMEFDPTLVGWLSAVETLEDLFKWFSKDDIAKLEEHGWFIHEFESDSVRFYEPFQHTVIEQSRSRVVRLISLNNSIAAE